MADILIRGMEMPTEQRIEVLIFKNGFVAYYDVYGHYLGQARATQLPEGHGRLIDADAVIEAYTPDSYDLNKMHMTLESFNKRPTVAAIKRAVRNAHTIVPAEGGGENGN